MIRVTCFMLLSFMSIVIALGQEAPTALPTTQAASQPTTFPAIRFATVSVYIDSGDQPLAAYQFEMTATQGDVKIVGIEGGEHPAYHNPPYYDLAAMMNRRVILAAFNTSSELPTGKTRVARVHVQITGVSQPQYELKLQVAATIDGQRIAAKVSIE